MMYSQRKDVTHCDAKIVNGKDWSYTYIYGLWSKLGMPFAIRHLSSMIVLMCRLVSE